MSMPVIERPDNPIDRGQSINDLIESVALVETGLSHIINAEGEKIQKVVDPDADYTIEEITDVNNSVGKMINSVSKLEMVLQNKLDIVKDLDTGTTTEFSLKGLEAQYITPVDQTIWPGATIIFDNMLINNTSNITYNSSTGEFSINTPGNYYISWWLIILGGGSTNVAIAVNNQPYSVTPIVPGAQYTQKFGNAYLSVTDTPTIITLTNSGNTEFTVPDLGSPIANLVILEVS